MLRPPEPPKISLPFRSLDAPLPPPNRVRQNVFPSLPFAPPTNWKIPRRQCVMPTSSPSPFHHCHFFSDKPPINSSLQEHLLPLPFLPPLRPSPAPPLPNIATASSPPRHLRLLSPMRLRPSQPPSSTSVQSPCSPSAHSLPIPAPLSPEHHRHGCCAVVTAYLCRSASTGCLELRHHHPQDCLPLGNPFFGLPHPPHYPIAVGKQGPRVLCPSLFCPLVHPLYLLSLCVTEAKALLSLWFSLFVCMHVCTSLTIG